MSRNTLCCLRNQILLCKPSRRVDACCTCIAMECEVIFYSGLCKVSCIYYYMRQIHCMSFIRASMWSSIYSSIHLFMLLHFTCSYHLSTKTSNQALCVDYRCAFPPDFKDIPFMCTLLCWTVWDKYSVTYYITSSSLCVTKLYLSCLLSTLQVLF